MKCACVLSKSEVENTTELEFAPPSSLLPPALETQQPGDLETSPDKKMTHSQTGP